MKFFFYSQYMPRMQ